VAKSKFGSLKVSGLQQWRQSELGRKQGKKEGAVIAANIAERAAVDARNLVTTEQYNKETAYRGGLIAAQRGGLASTILNLGGAAGDPENPYASQIVGTEAAGVAPELEGYKDRPMPKRKRDWAGEITPSIFGGYSDASSGKGSLNRGR